MEHALDNFARLRLEAARAGGQLQCLPIIIAASTRASACTLRRTASRRSRVKDLQLWPLTEADTSCIIQDLLQRMGRASWTSAELPDKVLVLLRLLGGNPQLLALALVALSGQHELSDEAYIVGTSQSHLPCAVYFHYNDVAGIESGTKIGMHLHSFDALASNGMQ
jgi:hypothetical protein